MPFGFHPPNSGIISPSLPWYWVHSKSSAPTAMVLWGINSLEGTQASNRRSHEMLWVKNHTAPPNWPRHQDCTVLQKCRKEPNLTELCYHPVVLENGQSSKALARKGSETGTTVWNNNCIEWKRTVSKGQLGGCFIRSGRLKWKPQLHRRRREVSGPAHVAELLYDCVWWHSCLQPLTFSPALSLVLL